MEPTVEEFAELLEQLNRQHGYFQWQSTFQQLAIVVANLQLALRHPSNTGEAATVARGIVDAMIASVERSSPRAAEILRMGFNPDYDVREG